MKQSHRIDRRSNNYKTTMVIVTRTKKRYVFSPSRNNRHNRFNKKTKKSSFNHYIIRWKRKLCTSKRGNRKIMSQIQAIWSIYSSPWNKLRHKIPYYRRILDILHLLHVQSIKTHLILWHDRIPRHIKLRSLLALLRYTIIGNHKSSR